MNRSPDFERTVKDLGRRIFAGIGREQPSTFNMNYWAGKVMNWSISKPEFKLNMFRLVDVLPALRNTAAVAQHVNEYLGKVGSSISGLAEWGLNVKANSIRAKITSMVVKKSVSQMASQFIAGETPQDSLKELRRLRKDGLCYTVDLLGEFSLSEKEALAYVARYMDALAVYGKEIPSWRESAPLVAEHPGESSAVCISVKLTALYSQCYPLNFERSVNILSERLASIARRAKEVKALLYVDAEDTGNNPIIYETFKNVFSSAEFKDFPYPGIVVQAYTKASRKVLEDLLAFAKKRGAPIAVRLVKGAYWDQETVSAKQNNWESPLFSHKESTDAHYEALSRTLIDNHELCLPAFGSHNIRSLAHACCYAKERGLNNKQFELQMLYGMAEPIAHAFRKQGYLVRLYVPLGQMLPGMGYLVRRLLENTSNESFLRHTFFDASDAEHLLDEPVMKDG